MPKRKISRAEIGDYWQDTPDSKPIHPVEYLERERLNHELGLEMDRIADAAICSLISKQARVARK
jgi:isopentenyldiphosphate isomerase